MANRHSGVVEIYNLGHSGNPAAWSIIGEPISSKGVADPLPNGAFVLDGRSGFQQRADKQQLAALYRPTESNARQVLVTVGMKGARCMAEINGDRIGKVDWGHKLSFAYGAQIVEKLGMSDFTFEHCVAGRQLLFSMTHIGFRISCTSCMGRNTDRACILSPTARILAYSTASFNTVAVRLLFCKKWLAHGSV